METEIARKFCKGCKTSKCLEEFHVNKKAKSGRAHRCKTCIRSYNKQRYNEIPDVKIKQQDRNKIRTEFLINVKKNIRCEKCGCTGTREIFDAAHVTRESKKRKRDGRPIRQLNNLSMNSMEKEIEKCRWLCIFCHRLETTKEQGPAHPGSRYSENRNKRLYIQEKIKLGECTDCRRKVTESNVSAFDFDHLPGNEKLHNISQMLRCPWESMLEEIEKCQLLCSCCHRKTTEVRRQAQRQKLTASRYLHG